MKCLIDADVLLHEIGWSGQFKDKETGEDVLLPSDRVCDLLDLKIKIIMEECYAEEPPVLFLSSSDWIVSCYNKYNRWHNDLPVLLHKPNFRYDVAKTKPYKGNRKNPKPVHFKNLALHMMENYNVVISQGGLEADDEICIAQRQHIKSGIPTTICSRDKDLRICQGWHYSWECGKQAAVGPVQTDATGYLFKRVKSDNTWDLFGYGVAFFLSQMLTGDSADNIPGLPKAGKALAWEVLSPLEGDKTAMINAVKTLYKETLGEDSREFFEEQGSLLWMVQNREEKFDVRKLV